MKTILSKDFSFIEKNAAVLNSTKPSSRGINRRGFLQVAGATGAGFSLASFMSANKIQAAELEELGHLELNAFVEVNANGSIRLYAHTPEKGQGIKTSLPMIIAEELGADWNDVTVVRAPMNEARYGAQRAGGSTSTPREWNPMRRAGAAARVMFISAAAKQMSVSPSLLYTENSQVINRESGQGLGFAELAVAAALEPIPDIDSLVFKDRSDYKLIGTKVGDVDNHIMVTGGGGLYGSDIQLPDMLYAVYEKCAATYGKVVSANLDHIKSMTGIVDAFLVEGNDNVGELLDGVAIVARSTWQAFKAKQELEVEWDITSASTDNNEEIFARALEVAAAAWPQELQIAASGDVEQQYENSNTEVLESNYRFPYLAHACMEPMNCTAHYHSDNNSLDIWAPTRQPGITLNSVENVFDIPQESITLHQMRMGGSFGRRRLQDYSCEVTAIARRFDVPIKLLWTREDDMIHDQYRPGGVYAFKGAVSREGRAVAMQTHLIGPAVRGRATAGTRLAASEFPALNIDNFRAAVSLIDTNTPTGSWRAPGSNATGWAVQSFMAEMAHAADRDYVEFLIEMMGAPQWFEPGNVNSLNTGRAVDVIKLAAEKSGWGKTLPAGRGMGFAFHFSHAGHVAEVVELSIDDNKKISIHKITVAVDIGPIINMSGALKQVEGGATDGLNSMLNLEISMQDGKIQQENFHQYNLLRMRNAPLNIEAHFIQSEYDPTGLGEPVLPPLMPAVTNAIFAVRGERIRTLPLSKAGYTI
ncbi:xanthine dehydrogenase family protein molybdopterin-binding subunit [Haliea sp. AH-315-K21]|uniref:Isoquinoline 1-oxidoreductase n=1 Tax=SAR86 cluster bacterium TaxID=2030880 RepID=A0A2A5CF79_9GAMM|nr:xanthine dehydrogenase family protein molybdopterin-binding subunit [Haliea sp. AH-315-K21]MBN4075206.1 xanthine dehydrogenase family protein molybdopterin-binding subunit [Gammaproteobacteria bacterium AH-315-E17]PCJ42155.1 MAG: isoquinoline 1-oxidoreductase [SAR86 cluster bacterium]